MISDILVGLCHNLPQPLQLASNVATELAQRSRGAPLRESRCQSSSGMDEISMQCRPLGITAST